MPSFDRKVDAYIAKSAEFAQPILEHLRELVHTACPQVEETIKWSFPHFEYNGILCNMAAFKYHCTFGFWKANLMDDPQEILTLVGKTAMGSFNKIKSLEDLPSERILINYIRQAVSLNENDFSLPAKKKPAKKSAPVKTPDYLLKALKKNKKALTTYENFSNSSKKEYVNWIAEAKTEETKSRRLATAVEWMAEGKKRDWKYIKK